MAAVPAIGRASRVEHPLGPASHAAQELYERHYRRILGFCQYQLGTRHEAEDAAQTTFMHALGALQRGVVPVREVPWLLTIARNVCRTRWDAGRRRGRIEFDGDPHVIEETAAVDAEPEWTLLGLEEALAGLPEQQRLAILLREWQGLSYHEIAEVLGMSVSAVETSIFRARRGLAKKLGDENGRRLGLGSLLTAFKSALFGGSGVAVKVAATAAVVVAGTGAAVGTATLRHDPAPPPVVSDAVPASEVPLPSVLSRVAPAPVVHRGVRPGATSAPRKAPILQAARPKTQPAAPKHGLPAATAPVAPTRGTSPAATPPASTAAPAATHPAPTPVQRASPAQPPATSAKPVEVVHQVTQPVVQTVSGVTKPVLDSVDTVVPPVLQTVADAAQPVANAVTNVTQPVVTTVTTVAAPLLPPPPAQTTATPASPLPPLPQLPLLPGHP